MRGKFGASKSGGENTTEGHRRHWNSGREKGRRWGGKLVMLEVSKK